MLCSSGGVELFVRAGKIKCTNTLESRLELMGTQVQSHNSSVSRLLVMMFSVSMLLSFESCFV